MRSGQLTFRQRLDNIEYKDEIPEKFIDQYVSTDIMDNPVLINKKYTMDEKSLLLHWNNKLSTWMQTTNKGTCNYDSNESPLETIAGGHEPVRTIDPLNNLRKEIEEWVCEREEEWKFMKEMENKIKAKRKEKEEVLQKLNKNIAAVRKELDAYLNQEKQELNQTTTEEKIALLFTVLDSLNKDKNKLELGARYYKDPATLQHEISQLLRKQEKNQLTAAEEEELARLLPSHKNMLTRFPQQHFSFFSRLSNQENESVSIASIQPTKSKSED